ncbi:MAG: FHA domain-containing protein [Planctomycetes bacterium]|nr:FHA domain-containing protein [Planctomycetota bacterium]
MKFIGIKNKDLAYDIEDKNGEYIIGRDEDCDIVMNFKGVSSQHCRLFIRDKQIALIDLGSSNGTLVNGAKIKRKILHPKDVIQIGAEKFNVILPAGIQDKPRLKKRPPKVDERSETSAEEHLSEDTPEKEDIVEEKPKKKMLTPRTSAGLKDRNAAREKASKLPKMTDADAKVKEAGSSVVWLIIFFVGGVLGIGLFISGMMMKSKTDADIKKITDELSRIKIENSTMQNRLDKVKTRVGEVKDSFIDLKTHIDDIANKTYASQRDTTTKVDEISSNRNLINEDIMDIQTKIAEIRSKIDALNE